MAAQGLQPLIRASPFFYLYDGYSAVYIFFALSGTVLTLAFLDAREPVALVIASRLIRLILPAAAACLLAVGVMTVVGQPNIAAGSVTGSVKWLHVLWQTPPQLAFLLKEAFINSVFLGYRETSTFSMLGVPAPLDAIGNSYVSPMWTLSIEFQGSLLILFWTRLFKTSKPAWALAVALGCGFFLFTHFICFGLGHGVALALRRGQLPALPAWLTVLLLMCGVAACVAAETSSLAPLADICPVAYPLHLPCSPLYQKTLGAMAIFFAVVTSPAIRNQLTRASAAVLGRLSFSIYLVHWPMVMGLASYCMLEWKDQTGLVVAQTLASLVAVAAAIALAMPFAKFDQFSISLARRIRQYDRAGVRQGAGKHPA